MLLVVTLCMVQHEAGVHTQVSFAGRAPIGGPFPASGIPAAAANTTVAFILCELREMLSSCEPNWMVNGWIRRKDVLTSIKPLNELSGNRYYKIQVRQLLVVFGGVHDVCIHFQEVERDSFPPSRNRSQAGQQCPLLPCKCYIPQSLWAL